MLPAVGGNGSRRACGLRGDPEEGSGAGSPESHGKRGAGGFGAEEEEVSPLDTLIRHCSWILAWACPVPFAIPRRNLHVCFGKWGCSLTQNRA